MNIRLAYSLALSLTIVAGNACGMQRAARLVRSCPQRAFSTCIASARVISPKLAPVATAPARGFSSTAHNGLATRAAQQRDQKGSYSSGARKAGLAAALVGVSVAATADKKKEGAPKTSITYEDIITPLVKSRTMWLGNEVDWEHALQKNGAKERTAFREIHTDDGQLGGKNTIKAKMDFAAERKGDAVIIKSDTDFKFSSTQSNEIDSLGGLRNMNRYSTKIHDEYTQCVFTYERENELNSKAKHRCTTKMPYAAFKEAINKAMPSKEEKIFSRK